MATSCGGAGESCPPEGIFNYVSPPSRKTVVNSKVMVVAVAVLFAVVLFILCLHVYAKWFWRNQATIVTSDGVIHTLSWRRRRYRGDPRLHRPDAAATATTVPQSVGLERAVVEALPTFEYSGDEMKLGLECAVCLEEFEEGETGRTLPQCGHNFHLDCIDMWLHSHSTCPLCRTSVALDDDTKQSPDAAVVQIQEQEAAVVGDVGAPFMAAMRASRRRQRSISNSTGLTNSLPRTGEDQEEAEYQTQTETPGTEFPPADATETRLQQSLKDYETPSVSAQGSVSRQASGIRAPFQVTIDIPRSGAAGIIGSNINNNNSANLMSPMARASASFRRLLSRGKSVVTPQSDEGGPSSSPHPSSSPPPPSV